MEEACNSDTTVAVDASAEEARFQKMEESKISTTSDYAQVIFSNIAKMYPEDAHVQCKYTITPSLVPSKWDWVGLYKVGWMSPRDKVHYEWAVIPTNYKQGEEVECSVLFHSYNLPKDDGEFYQFCYINYSGQVRGASTPFQFKRPGADDFVECEDEDLDMLVVNTRTNVLQETIEKMENEKAEFVKAQEVLTVERESLLGKLAQNTKQLNDEIKSKEEMDNKLKEYETKIDQLNTEAKDLGEVHDILQKKIDTLTKEKEELEEAVNEKQQRIVQLEGEVRGMRNTVDQSVGKVQMLEEEKELFKNHFTTSEEKIVAFQTEIENLKKRLSTEETLAAKQKEKLQTLETELRKERKTRERMTNLRDADKETIESLTERYQNAKDQLATMESCKAMLNEQLKALQEAHDQMSSSMEKAKTEAHSLKVRQTKLEDQHKKDMETSLLESAKWKSKCEDAEKERSELMAKLSEVQSSRLDSEKVQQGSLYAMKEAYNSLKEQQTSLTKKYNTLRTENKELTKLAQRRNISHELKRENEDMRERLDMARDEYTKLYQKYRHGQLLLEKSRRAETGRSQRSSTSETTEASSQYDVDTKDVAVESLSGVELQSQLDDLATELEERQAKKNKYKKQLMDEREKNQILQAHYQGEYEKFKVELEKERTEKRELQTKLDELRKESGVEQVIVEQPRYGNPYTTELPPVVYPHKGMSPVYPPTQPKYPPTQSKYPNPYTRSEGSVEPEQTTVCEPCFLETDDTTPTLEQPLKPLPAPMQPEILPSAKLAAVKNAAGLISTSSSSDSLHEVNVDVQKLEDELLTDKQNAEEEMRTQASAPPLEDGDEDRFHDAVGEPQKTCIVCSHIFSLETTDKEYSNHVNNHFVYTCPMCNKEFDKEKTTDEEFETHVQDHLKY